MLWRSREDLSVTREPDWLDWSRRLAAIAQSGLAYGPSQYDAERYELVREIAAEIAAAGADAPLERILELFGRDAGHATPKVDVRGAVFREGAVLLVRERADGLWNLPGGWVDIQESPSEAVEREVREESGYRVRAARLLALWDRRKHRHPPHAWHVYKVVFGCELLSDEPAPIAGETDTAKFFPATALPELGPKTTREQIDRLFELERHPSEPPDFD
jgi:ADP-ribose pyrophosphatase YjhB (NUDIX family)